MQRDADDDELLPSTDEAGGRGRLYTPLMTSLTTAPDSIFGMSSCLALGAGAV